MIDAARTDAGRTKDALNWMVVLRRDSEQPAEFLTINLVEQKVSLGCFYVMSRSFMAWRWCFSALAPRPLMTPPASPLATLRELQRSYN